MAKSGSTRAQISFFPSSQNKTKRKNYDLKIIQQNKPTERTSNGVSLDRQYEFVVHYGNKYVYQLVVGSRESLGKRKTYHPIENVNYHFLKNEIDQFIVADNVVCEDVSDEVQLLSPSDSDGKTMCIGLSFDERHLYV